MKREYHKWFSPNLGKEMELIILGHGGANIIVFPTRCGRFYDYENWQIADSLSEKLENGVFRLICLDSVDDESLYCNWKHPRDKITRHIEYEKYILNEVIPLISQTNCDKTLIAHGCSLGAFHAMNIACRHPKLFNKVVSFSGRYDLTNQIHFYSDLFNDFYNEDIYYNMPNHYLPNLSDQYIIDNLRKLEIVFVVGKDDVLYENNILLKSVLEKLELNFVFRAWDGKAHKPKCWSKMAQAYL